MIKYTAQREFAKQKQEQSRMNCYIEAGQRVHGLQYLPTLFKTGKQRQEQGLVMQCLIGTVSDRRRVLAW